MKGREMFSSEFNLENAFWASTFLMATKLSGFFFPENDHFPRGTHLSVKMLLFRYLSAIFVVFPSERLLQCHIFHILCTTIQKWPNFKSRVELRNSYLKYIHMIFIRHKPQQFAKRFVDKHSMVMYYKR